MRTVPDSPRSGNPDPPDSNKGGQTPSVDTPPTISLHWLTATFKWHPYLPTAAEMIERLSGFFDAGRPRLGEPYPRNYSHGLQWAGGTLSYHPGEPQMGFCANWTGVQVEDYYKAGKTPQELLQRVRDASGKLTRLDIAWDIFRPYGIEVVYDAIEDGDFKCRAKPELQKYPRPDDATYWGRPVTVYLGSRQSERRICIYNKAAEQGTPHPWTRVEYRARRERAEQLATAILQDGPAAAFRAVVEDFAPGGTRPKWWREMLRGDVAGLPPMPRKETDTQRWLLEQVLPVLDRELAAGGPAARKLDEAFSGVLLHHKRRRRFIQGMPPKEDDRE